MQCIGVSAGMVFPSDGNSKEEDSEDEEVEDGADDASISYQADNGSSVDLNAFPRGILSAASRHGKQHLSLFNKCSDTL